MKTHRLLFRASALLGLGGLLFQAHGQSTAAGPGTAAAPAAKAQTTVIPGEGALALGKKIFVERCAKCHGEDGTKPVGDGLPLSERKLSDEDLAKMVRGRLKSSPENEQKAVAAYIRCFQKK